MAVVMTLKEVREAKGVTIRALEMKSGISRSAISNIELNYTMPKIDTLVNLARSLQVSVLDLYKEVNMYS